MRLEVVRVIEVKGVEGAGKINLKKCIICGKKISFKDRFSGRSPVYHNIQDLWNILDNNQKALLLQRLLENARYNVVAFDDEFILRASTGFLKQKKKENRGERSIVKLGNFEYANSSKLVLLSLKKANSVELVNGKRLLSFEDKRLVRLNNRVIKELFSGREWFLQVTLELGQVSICRHCDASIKKGPPLITPPKENKKIKKEKIKEKKEKEKKEAFSFVKVFSLEKEESERKGEVKVEGWSEECKVVSVASQEDVRELKAEEEFSGKVEESPNKEGPREEEQKSLPESAEVNPQEEVSPSKEGLGDNSSSDLSQSTFSWESWIQATSRRDRLAKLSPSFARSFTPNSELLKFREFLLKLPWLTLHKIRSLSFEEKDSALQERCQYLDHSKPMIEGFLNNINAGKAYCDPKNPPTSLFDCRFDLGYFACSYFLPDGERYLPRPHWFRPYAERLKKLCFWNIPNILWMGILQDIARMLKFEQYEELFCLICECAKIMKIPYAEVASWKVDGITFDGIAFLCFSAMDKLLNLRNENTPSYYKEVIDAWGELLEKCQNRAKDLELAFRCSYISRNFLEFLGISPQFYNWQEKAIIMTQPPSEGELVIAEKYQELTGSYFKPEWLVELNYVRNIVDLTKILDYLNQVKESPELLNKLKVQGFRMVLDLATSGALGYSEEFVDKSKKYLSEKFLEFYPQFERFWELYPKRGGEVKEKVWEEFAGQLAIGASPEELVLAAKNYAEFIQANAFDAKYIKRADNFLSHKTWKKFLKNPS